jgi:hypothetical protein
LTYLSSPSINAAETLTHYGACKKAASRLKMIKYLGGWSMLAAASLLSSLVYIWFRKIEAIVPEPYLVSKIS